MQKTVLLLFSLVLPGLGFAQDTLSFGGIYDLPGAEVRATYTPVSRLANRFTIEEVYRLPGTFYDPARLVALLPGVVQTNDQANHLSVRGNTPNANLWRINGLAIVNPNHTANAGTFYDFPTLSGGGVNAISAQMLDNSGFFAGPLPLEYGYATGGTFDLRLRPGAKRGAKQQIQAGFIGFDGMAEGPIGKSEKTSYLVNARYSFTGLLADMGVDFGGEEIRFADLNAHFNHAWDGGEISAFTILGSSSNMFEGPDSNEVKITEQKELFDIDFASDLRVFGTSFYHNFIASSISGGVAWSSISSGREQKFSGSAISASSSLTDLQRLSAFLKYDRLLGSKVEWEIGSEFLLQNYSAFIEIKGENRDVVRRGNPRIDAYSPYTGFNFFFGKHTFRVGTRLSYFEGDGFSELAFEPRVSWTRRGRKSALNLDFSFTAQPFLQELITAPSYEDRVRVVPKGFNTSLKYSRRFNKISAALTGFLQNRQLEYGVKSNTGSAVTSVSSGFSMNNFLELDPFVVFDGYSTTTNFGAELEVAGGKKDKGVYYRGSLTWLRSLYSREFGSSESKYDIPFIFNLTIGREWESKDRKNRDRLFGVNAAFIAHAGERTGRIPSNNPSQDEVLQYFVGQNLTAGIRDSYGTYFRPDLRIYKTKTRPKTTTTLALDVQNVAGIQNTANIYYDAFLDQPTERFQLGLIPVLSYRIVWR